MMNLQILQSFDAGLKAFKHQLYCELIREACSSAHSVTSPELALVLHVEESEVSGVTGFDLIGNAVVHPFTRNLQNSLALSDKQIKPCSTVPPKQFLRFLWYVAKTG